MTRRRKLALIGCGVPALLFVGLLTCGLLGMALTAAGVLPTTTPQTGAEPLAAARAAGPSLLLMARVAATTESTPASTFSWQVSVEGVERIELPKKGAGSGSSWLLVRTKVTNTGTKTTSVKERQVALTVDGQTVSPDKDAIDAAEKQKKGKGFGGIFGTSIKSGKSDTRISVFNVPNAGREFTLSLREGEKSTTDIAAPVTLTTQAVQALAGTNATAAPTTASGPPAPMPSPPTPTATTAVPPTSTPAPPTPTPVPPSPTPVSQPTATSVPSTPTPTPKPPTPPAAPLPVIDVAGQQTATGVVGDTVTLTLLVKNVGPGDIGNLTISVGQSYAKHFVLVRTAPPAGDDDSWGSRSFSFGALPQGESQTYTIVLSPKEAGEFKGPVQFFDRSIGGGGGKQLKFVNGNAQLETKTTVRAR